MSCGYDKAMELVVRQLFGETDNGPHIGRNMGMYMVMYDVSDGYLRNMMVKALGRHGFVRVQLSVFMGCIADTSMKTLRETLARLINAWGWETDSLMVIPITNDTLKDIRCFGKDVDMERMTNKSRSLFF